ncbi:hypothetical protein LBMAG05_07820 [Actinomycetes bacterium]|nr:hypothetical protein LBMAG05_07820 [Actinomycetes bacterium]
MLKTSNQYKRIGNTPIVMVPKYSKGQNNNFFLLRITFDHKYTKIRVNRELAKAR